MTRDDMIRMAREAGFEYFSEKSPWLPGFERFANLVAAAEREACAKLADYYDDVIIAKAIRARGEEK